MTKYELSFGGSDVPSQAIEYHAPYLNNAALRFAIEVSKMAQRADLFAAWARLRRLPDDIITEGQDLIAWTKM